jgi:hypothetical protein
MSKLDFCGLFTDREKKQKRPLTARQIMGILLFVGGIAGLYIALTMVH